MTGASRDYQAPLPPLSRAAVLPDTFDGRPVAYIDVPRSVQQYVVIRDEDFAGYTYDQLDRRLYPRTVLVQSEARRVLGLQLGEEMLERVLLEVKRALGVNDESDRHGG